MNRALRIQENLKVLSPEHFELENESDQHAGPPGRETHFKLLFVSPVFQGLSRVERQRKIYDLLKTELSSGLHALTMRLLTPEEWARSQNPGSGEFQSPACASTTNEKNKERNS